MVKSNPVTCSGHGLDPARVCADVIARTISVLLQPDSTSGQESVPFFLVR